MDAPPVLPEQRREPWRPTSGKRIGASATPAAFLLDVHFWSALERVWIGRRDWRSIVTMTESGHKRSARSTRSIDPCAPSRCRKVYIDAMGEVVNVPRHIRRLDGARVRGWQVLFSRPSRYFSDNQYGGPGKALTAARKYLRSIWRPEEWQTSRGVNPVTREPTTGVRLVLVESRGIGYWYAEATHPAKGQAPRRFYIGRTRKAERVKAARDKALQQRAEWLASHPVPTR